MNYIENEQKAFEWFKQNFDPAAELHGGYDSTEADIYSPKMFGYIEVKMIDNKHSARCGQFTINTRFDNPAATAILNGNTSQDKLQEFVSYHYRTKKVVGFIIGIDEQSYCYLTFDDFLKTAFFSVQSYCKRSGTRPCPIKDQDALLGLYEDFIRQDKRLYCPKKERWGEYFFYNNEEFFISLKNQGEIRKCSNTKNMTYHIEVKIK